MINNLLLELVTPWLDGKAQMTEPRRASKDWHSLINPQFWKFLWISRQQHLDGLALISAETALQIKSFRINLHRSVRSPADHSILCTAVAAMKKLRYFTIERNPDSVLLEVLLTHCGTHLRRLVGLDWYSADTMATLDRLMPSDVVTNDGHTPPTLGQCIKKGLPNLELFPMNHPTFYDAEMIPDVKEMHFELSSHILNFLADPPKELKTLETLYIDVTSLFGVAPPEPSQELSSFTTPPQHHPLLPTLHTLHCKFGWWIDLPWFGQLLGMLTLHAPTIKNLTIEGLYSPNLIDDIAVHLPHLQTLTLGKCQTGEPQAVARLGNLRNLKSLHLKNACNRRQVGEVVQKLTECSEARKGRLESLRVEVSFAQFRPSVEWMEMVVEHLVEAGCARLQRVEFGCSGFVEPVRVIRWGPDGRIRVVNRDYMVQTLKQQAFFR